MGLAVKSDIIHEYMIFILYMRLFYIKMWLFQKQLIVTMETNDLHVEQIRYKYDMNNVKKGRLQITVLLLRIPIPNETMLYGRGETESRGADSFCENVNWLALLMPTRIVGKMIMVVKKAMGKNVEKCDMFL